jgi:CubicO group peptidase (beta-lactamase class C family)
MKRALPPGARDAPGWAAARFDRDRILEVWTWGHSDLSRGEEVQPDTPFRWFSITKNVTAIAVLSLVERGRIALCDPVVRHLPWFAPADVTIEQLLTHSAGLVDPSPLSWVHPPGDPRRTPEELTRHTLDRHRRRIAGARYTNLGYLVLGELVRAASGVPFADHVRSILAPVGIEASFMPRGAIGHERLRSIRTAAMAAIFARRLRRFVSYVREGWVGLTPFEIEGEAYGGLVGSLEQLVRLGRVHLGDGTIDGVRILDRELARDMRRARGPFGLGFWIYENGWIGHGGWAGGFRSELRLHPSQGIGVAVLANGGDASTEDVARAIPTAAARFRAG